jgi:O-antigen/teichoic acid export membrane protein
VIKTTKSIGYFFSGAVVSKVLGMLATLTLAKLLVPGDYGTWMALLLVPSYGTIACLGTVETLLKKYPYYIGQGNKVDAQKVEEGVLGSVLESGSVFILIGLCFKIGCGDEAFGRVGEYLMLMVAGTSISFLYAFFLHRFAAHQDFRGFSVADSGRAILTFVLVLWMSSIWGLKGTVMGWLATEIIVCMLIWIFSIRMCGPLRPTFGLRKLIDLARIGFPITIIWWFFMLQGTADRVISISMLGEVQTGFYGLGLSLVSTLVLVSLSFGQVLYPKVNEAVGANVSDDDLFKLVVMPAQALSLLISFMVGVLIFLTPWIYIDLFAKYGPGLVSAQILLMGAFFSCITRPAINYLIAKDQQKMLLWLSVLALFIKIIGNVAFVILGFGINGIGLSTAVSAGFLAIMIWKIALKGMKYCRSGMYKILLVLFTPFALLLFLVVTLATVFPSALKQSGLISFGYLTIFVFSFLGILLILSPMRVMVRGLVLTAIEVLLGKGKLDGVAVRKK